MKPNTIVDILWAETLPDMTDSEPGRYFKVGGKFLTTKVNSLKIPIFTEIGRITIQADEPGLHCMMRRICVWDSTKELLAEFPYIAVSCIGYK